jgi:hypothetical protein
MGGGSVYVAGLIERNKTMPHLHEHVMLRAWRHRNESGRIHYMAAYVDGKKRHLYVDDNNPLYAVLDSHLLAQGYTGPASDAEEDEQ